MLIAEELYLLMTDQDGKQEQPGTSRSYGQVAALVTDLIAAGRVALSEERRPRVHLLSIEPTRHPVLDFGLQTLPAKDGARLDRVVGWGRLNPENVIVESLVGSGVLRLGKKTMLGLGRPSTPEVDPLPEQQLRSRIAAVLAGQNAPSLADASLLSILQGLSIAHKILTVESGGMRARELKSRIEDLAAQTPAGTAVERAVRSMNAAIMTAAMVPTITGGAAAG